VAAWIPKYGSSNTAGSTTWACSCSASAYSEISHLMICLRIVLASVSVGFLESPSVAGCASVGVAGFGGTSLSIASVITVPDALRSLGATLLAAALGGFGGGAGGLVPCGLFAWLLLYSVSVPGSPPAADRMIRSTITR